MPYAWTDEGPGGTEQHLKLWTHNSLPKAGFAAMVSGTFLLILLPALPVLGTPVLWGLLPFLMGAVWALFAALRYSYRTGETSEDLHLTRDRVHLVRHNPRKPDQEWEANPHWVRPHLYPKGPVPAYLTLTGNGREVELGAFLTPDERQGLYEDLLRKLT